MKKPKENHDYRYLENEFLAYAVYNDPESNNPAWHIIAVMAKELLKNKGLTPEEIQYNLGNYKGSGKVAIMQNNKFIKFEGE